MYSPPTVLTAAGLIGFSLSSGLWSAAVALLLVGFGLGRLIASSNILAGRRYATHTGSALSTLNFFWSLGAVGTGLLTAWLLPRLHLASLLLSVAAAFLLTGLGGATGWLFQPAPPATRSIGEPQRLAPRTFLLFTALLLLYGGLETTLSSWLPTLEQRYFAQPDHAQPHIAHHWLAGQSALVLLWTALTAGRMLAAAALRRWPETVVLRCGLAASVLLILALASIHGSLSLSMISILLGLSLAPWFPAAFALLLHHNPTAREAGFILATSAIGAAIFPWLTGIASTHMGSLRLAMGIPACLALLLLMASFLPQRDSPAPLPSQLWSCPARSAHR